MAAFLLALIAVFLTSLGARDQVLVSALSQRLNRHIGLLAAGSLTSVGTAIAMSFAGVYVANILPDNAKEMLVAIALVLASIELIWPVKAPELGEPTRSLGAITLVLLVRQWTDAARFLIFAFAAWSGLVWPAAIGGALGGIAAVSLGWMMSGELARKIPMGPIRIVMAITTVCLAGYIGVSARGLLG
ncbi:hypothetical protein GCM10023115_09550 [Pontixanthobacter gangjinensis]|uniref:GDT1 family protein n=1 Tax=Pontixanthobacter gangjinensis TaxID=1028742 RepID=A0A6I4SK10_9SPHN|nr:hypothetical protein [Pontixanthobacter gangjinensis]MXO56201.1 hypothetical protein [Pontixanthobacter gangjinensis]